MQRQGIISYSFFNTVVHAAAWQRAHAKLIFIGYLKISCFYHVICENDSVRPETEGHPPAAGKGGVIFASTGVRIPSLPLELMNNKSNNKKNELWKMKLSM